jgi:hypothetical protein
VRKNKLPVKQAGQNQFVAWLCSLQTKLAPARRIPCYNQQFPAITSLILLLLKIYSALAKVRGWTAVTLCGCELVDKETLYRDLNSEPENFSFEPIGAMALETIVFPFTQALLGFPLPLTLNLNPSLLVWGFSNSVLFDGGPGCCHG